MIGINPLGLFEPGFGKRFILCLDPGERTGWALANWENGDLSVTALGTLPANEALEICRRLNGVIHHLIIEQPAPRGTPALMAFVGAIVEAFRPSAGEGFLELYIIPPGVWKQYPKRKIDETVTALLLQKNVLNTPHVRDAVGLLAWWWITTGREVLGESRSQRSDKDQGEA